MKRLICVSLIFLSGSASIKAQSPSFIKDSLDSYIQKGIAQWDIPGLAIAIVKDGKTIVSKGYGVRDLKTKDPVDENTLFMIASNSKLFTGTALAQLDYNKKLSLDDKVTRYLPGFQLYDKTSTELATIKDVLSHRIGTKTFQGDFTFWNGTLSRQQIVEKMKLLKPSGQFRQDFGYCNSCFLTAGEVIPVVTGKRWEEYVQDSILKPLGMSNTYMLTEGMASRNNVSRPYTNQFTGKITELPYDQVDNLGPAGSMVSNVKDVSKWLLTQLDSGRFEGKRVLPWPVIRKTRDINLAMSSRKSPVNPSHFTGYGLGVFMTDFAGKQVFWHTGGAFGFVTNTCFVPELNLGITILTNNDNQNFFELLRYQILDAYLDQPYVNRSEKALPAQLKGIAEAKKEVADLENRIGKGKPELPLAAYAGNYKNEIYGPITIKEVKNKSLEITFLNHKSLKATLQYMDKNEWLMRYNNIAYGVFATKFQIEGKSVKSITIKANDFIEYDPYIFVKD
ncbi:serine hydrolase [Daejeonella oryzae]|uniref:serine hydrolase n=1 Tax=Daejeonella oryzae TaxID=1122943 RepID=UPI0003FDB8E2|nr:serine hydrolase [Daejeonella oryzae]